MIPAGISSLQVFAPSQALSPVPDVAPADQLSSAAPKPCGDKAIEATASQAQLLQPSRECPCQQEDACPDPPGGIKGPAGAPEDHASSAHAPDNQQRALTTTPQKVTSHHDGFRAECHKGEGQTSAAAPQSSRLDDGRSPGADGLPGRHLAADSASHGAVIPSGPTISLPATPEELRSLTVSPQASGPSMLHSEIL